MTREKIEIVKRMGPDIMWMINKSTSLNEGNFT
jgi:hypothetical protein